jgi:mRNA interferase MazF
MNCRRGDVVLVLFPDSNLRTSKRRPALVVQADGLDAHLPQTIVAMITSNMARAGHPSRVIVRVGSGSARASGLLMDSVIMTDNLATVHYSEIDSVIGAFTGVNEIDAALRTTLAL